jgi:ligand-binding sensor domain-containing protein
MRRSKALTIWAVITAVIAGTTGLGVLVAWHASSVLNQSKQQVLVERQIRFTAQPWSPPTENNFEPVSSPDVFLQAARFQDRLYVAGPSALTEYDLAGALLRHFAVGRELPSSELVALAVNSGGSSGFPELVIATASDGFLIFDGKNFRQVYPASPDVRALTTMLALPGGRLLLGTKKHGVLIYDGKAIRELHETLSHTFVRTLSGTETDLWVGTQDSGVLHWHAGITEAFGEEQGLPDRQVQAIAAVGDKIYVGTPMGIAEFDRGRFSRRLGEGLLVTALSVHRQELLVGTEDQGVLRIPLGSPSKRPSHLQTSSEIAEVQQFLQTPDHTYVIARSGLFDLQSSSSSRGVLQPPPAVLSDRNISALAADKNGRLWVGYFDRGLDLLQNDASRVLHVENQHVFCVNRIWPDEKSSTILVATANGLVRMTAAGAQEQVLTRKDGLIADHVTDVAQYRDGLAIATPAGLTFLDSSGARSLYAFHGLVNNHIYALGVSGEDLMVGTLGGISAVDRGNIRASFIAGASGLQQNWITAVVPVGDAWMVGTYGSGVMSMDRSGHFHPFASATARLEINPNAMLVTSRHVFAGTLGNGLLVYDRAAARWSTMQAGLPSQNVTALAESNGYIYVGTDNGLVRIQEQELRP